MHKRFLNKPFCTAYLDLRFHKYRVRTDLEKSLKMTLVLENSWNSKKMQFVLELSLNFEKNLLDNQEKSLKMIENRFFGCSAQ